MKVFLITIFSAIALIILPFMPQIPSLLDTHMPKRGRVIDTETGKGLPNAFVLSSAEFSSDPIFFGPSGHLFLYSVLTRTDSDGRYIIPSTWSDIHIGTPGTNPHFSWVITVFEPGYAVVGDERALDAHEASTRIGRKPKSTFEQPKRSASGESFFSIEPIRMYKPKLTLSMATWYYSEIWSVLRSYSTIDNIDQEAFRLRGYNYLMPFVCSEDPKSEISRATAHTIIMFSTDANGELRMHKQLEPEGYTERDYEMAKVKTGDVCSLITYRRGTP